MYNLVKKNSLKILISIISIMILFLGLTAIYRKGNKSLTERDRRLANYDQYQTGDELVDGTDYVTFDAYFLEKVNGTTTKIRGNYVNVNSTAELWIDLHVFGDVTLKDASIEIVNSNVKTSGYLYKSSIIPSTTAIPNGGAINLNPSIAGSTLNNKITISSNLTNDLGSHSGTNKIILTGIVVKPNGEEINVTKEVSYIVDWYFDDFAYYLSSKYGTKQSFPYTRIIDCPNDDSRYNYHHEWNGKNYEITYNLKTYTNSPLIKTANIEAKIPDLNGEHPIDVKMKDANVTYSYDAATQTLTATREAELNGTLFTKKAYTYADNNTQTYYNDWEIIIEYPKDVENDSQTIPVSVDTYYEYYQIGENGAINVITTEKKNHIYTHDYVKPIIRTTIPACGDDPDRLEFLFNLSVGSYSSTLKKYYINRTDMTKTYKGVDTANPTTYYNVTWRVYLSYFDRFEDDSITSLVLTDVAADTASGRTLDDISYYKTIYVGNIATYLGASGSIKLYNNETNELLHVFTALDWSSPYTFEDGVSSIRIETSEFVNKIPMKRHYEQWGWQDDHLLELFSIGISKEIDNQQLKNTYDYATYLNMSSINTQIRLTGTRYRADENRNAAINSSSYNGSANLMDKQSATVEISANKSSIDSTVVNNVHFNIKTGSYGDIVDGYKDAEYIMVLPDWILDLDINSITSNNSSVNIVGFEKVEVNNHKCVRIITENEQPTSYSIIIDADIIPDARKIDRTDNVIVYASNPLTSVSSRNTKDTYDVDRDGNTEEYQNYGTSSLRLAAPNEIITTTTINYKDNDNNESTVVSPMIAEVDPVLNQSAAQVEIGLTNNALYPTKDIKVIGKLAYQGNTYQIGDGDLGSEFNVKMTDDGITIPSELVGKATVYYSDNETPTDDINSASNNWKTKENVTDFNNIKSYLIVINDYTLQVGASVKFTYDIEVPNTSSNLNKKTFFTHGVYYNIVDGENILPSSVGGAKLGVRISRQFNLDLTNYKAASTRTIPNTKYVLTDEEGNQKILSTDEDGHDIAKNLYVGKEYKLQQLKVKTPYILDEEEKTIEVINDTNDQLSVSVNGVLKSAELEGTKKLKVVHENEVRYDIIIENKDLDTDESIAFSKFKITGKGYENGVTVTVGSDGKMLLNYLYLDELYEVEQIKADSYSLAKKFTIKLTRDTDGTVKITVKKVAVMGEPVNIGAGYYRFYAAYDYYEPLSVGYREHCVAYFPIDLTEFTDVFSMIFKFQYRGRYSSYDYFKLFLTDNITDLAGLNGASPFVALWYNNTYSAQTVTPTTYNAYDATTGTYTVKPIEADKQYYLYVDYYDYGYSSNGYVYKPTFANSAGLNYEYLIKDETADVETNEYIYATQAIQDSSNQDAPVLTVTVKNKKIPTYTLRINKVNAETKEPLAGAQFKIEGDGLPESGKYITTDENGQATVELYKQLANNPDDNYETINNIIAIKKYSTNYKVTEVTAPVGYTLDDKTVEFLARYNPSNGINYDWYNKNIDMDLDDPDGSLNIEYLANTETQFREFSYDRATNTIDVTIYDYPIINIVKKDAETGEVLPNTLFSIFKIETVNEVEILVPATDEKGNIVGTPTTIDGAQQYIVSTDENGKLMFSLSAGKYQLKEVQASSEKYTLVGTTYYFGVGETIPYRAKGVDYVGTIPITNNYYWTYDQTSNNYKSTSDGGLVLTTADGHIIKYDKDLNVEWDVDGWVTYTGSVYIVQDENKNETYYAGTSYYDSNDGEYHYYLIPLDPTDTVNNLTVLDGKSDNKTYPGDIVETSDGGFIVTGSNTNILVKYDADGNRVWQSDVSMYRQKYFLSHVCTYEGNTNSEGKVLLYRYDHEVDEWVPYHERRDEWNSNLQEWEHFYDGELVYIDKPTENDGGIDRRYIDENTYYCNYSTDIDPASGDPDGDKFIYSVYENRFYYAGHVIAELPDGGVAILTTGYENSDNHYGSTESRNLIKLYDGTIKQLTHVEQLLILDGQGHLIDAMDVPDLYEEAFAEYKARYGVSATSSGIEANHWVYHDALRSYKNGDLLLFMYPGRALKLAKNQTTGKYEIAWYTPIGINGSAGGYWYGNGDGRPDIVPTDDGGFYIKPQYDQFSLNDCNTWGITCDDYPNLVLDNIEKEPYSDGELYPKYIYDPLFKFEERTLDDGSKQAYLTNFTIWAQSTRERDDVYVYGNTNLLKRFYSSVSGLAAIRTTDGGYILGFNPQIWNDGDFYHSVELASGETIIIKNNAFTLFKVNIDGGIEWIKQYNNISYWNTNPHMVASEDGTRIYLPVRIYQGNTATEYGNPDFSITNDNNSNGLYILAFDINDEITPEGPEAYTLNIDNKRKEYKVTASSNLGGNVFVTNPDNGQNVITTDGSSKTTLETVKYGDTNKYIINIEPDPTYSVVDVKVNGEPIGFIVNADGTVTLNQIENIMENKDISITYVKDASTVVVKHYLKDTTESVFGDEVLSGIIDEPYETNAKSSELYSLASDENGTYILPTNRTGTFTSNPITVIYYYVENEVDLKTNYYIDGTEIELAPTNVQRKVLGSRYQTAPLDIPDYEYTRTIGDESGTLTRDVTEVTFMYREVTESKITIRHVDRATNTDIVEPIVKVVPRYSDYTTDDQVNIPTQYKPLGTPANAAGPANDTEIEVIYYYEVIPFNISVDKKINSVLLNGEKQTITDGKNISITPTKKDNLIVYYEIVVENTGDIKATFKVVEGEVPGFDIYDQGQFTKVGNDYVLNVELEPGEKKTYKIGYKWNQKDYGISINEVELNDVQNERGFAEPDGSDNKSNATVETKIPKEVLGEIVIPNTIDKVKTSIILLITSLIGMIISLLLMKKRRIN